MRLAALTFALIGSVGLAHAADLPTQKTSPAPAQKPNCWASLWTWLNASADDCPLGAYGITLYGTFDLGYGYQDWGAPKSATWDKVNYGIVKSGYEHIWQPVYNGLSTSVLGLRMKQSLAPVGLPGWSLVGVIEAGVNPYSGMFLNGARSLADNNVNSANGRVTINGKNYYYRWQTANSDSSRNGSWGNSQAYVGISSNVWGTATFGRTNSLSFDTQSKYDPVASTAFSLIGFSGTFPGFGDTEATRINTALTYRVAIPNVYSFSAVRFGAQAQVGGYGVQNSSMAAYYGQAGFDWGNLSFDSVVGWAKDAVALANFSGSNIAECGGGWNLKVNNACYNPNNVLKATLSNNFGAELMASYKWDRARFYGGYIYTRNSNPSDDYLTGFRTIYPGIIAPPGFFKNGVLTNDAITANAYNFSKILQTVWTGVRYSVWENLDIAVGFYYQWQNNFNFTADKYGVTTAAACTGQGAFISSNKCAGSQDAISVFVDYKPLKRVDIYAGVMVSNVYGGLANGFFNYQPYYNPVTKTVQATQHAFTQNYDPTIGVRIRF